MFQLDIKELQLISEAITADILIEDIGQKFCLSCNNQCEKGMK